MTVLPLVLTFFFQQPAGYTVSGIVVDGATGGVLPKARVLLAGTRPAISVTGADGRFRFDNVDAGMHQLAAQRIGYQSQSFAQRSLTTNLSTGIAVGENHPTENLIFRLIPNATIAGSIRDAGGEPVAGMTVGAYRIYGTGKNRKLGGYYSASTDDRGYYRLRPPAGEYVIFVSGHPAQEIASVQPMAYPMTFYPGSIDPALASLIAVKPGEEARGDMALHAVPSVRIEGEVPSADGRPFGSLYVGIMGPSIFGTNVVAGASASVTRGKFTFSGIAAGKYHLQLTQRAASDEPAQVVGVADVNANVDLSGVSIALAPPRRVSIHLTMRGQPPPSNAQLQAVLDPIDGVGGSSVPIGPDGRGVFPLQTRPGRYALEAQKGKRLAIESVTVNGTPQPGIAIEVPETGSVDIDAVANTATVDIAGKLLRDGSPQSGMLMILVQRDSWEQIGVYRSDQSNSDGSFEWDAVPPGPYLAFALENGEPADYDDAGALRELLSIAQPITVGDGPVQQVELKFLPLPSRYRGGRFSRRMRPSITAIKASRRSSVCFWAS